jgi:carbamoyltransferase
VPVTLGIGGFLGHDANAALVVDGRIVAAAQEERYSRRKHDGRFPLAAIQDCLRLGGLEPKDVDAVVFAEKHLQSRLYDQTGMVSNRLSAQMGRLFPKRWEADYLGPARALFPKARFSYAWHHVAHAVGAYYTSDCERAAFLCVDGKGEDVNATIGRITPTEVEWLAELPGESGLGLFYTLLTYFLGFMSFGSEYKVMGLAPYGTPEWVEALTRLYESDERGAFVLRKRLSFRPADLEAGFSWLESELGLKRRLRHEPLTQTHADLAASLQVIFEEQLFRQARYAREVTGEEVLLLTGGCAQNVVAAGKLRESGLFEEVHNSPVAGDMGSGLGAALLEQRCRGVLSGTRVEDHGFLLGPEPGPIPKVADPWEVKLGDRDLFEVVAERLANGRIVGWCRGRMELGARALGARSIFADARNPTMQSRLNQAIKFREGFRPFAPIILEEFVKDWFDTDRPIRFMQFVSFLRPERRKPMPEGLVTFVERLQAIRAEIPAVIHLDYSSRLQTVHPAVHPETYRLLKAFYAQTGCPVLINTSFNVAGQPIVRTSEDAWECFIHSEIDDLVVGDRLFENPRQLSREEKIKWVQGFTASS